MNLEPTFQALENTWLGTFVRQSIWIFPVVECFHLLALALLGGMVLVLNLRMLGFGLVSPSVSELASKVRPWFNLALVTILGTGVLMFLSEAIKCYFSPPFWYKMTSLLLAIIFSYTLHNRVTAAAPGKVSPTTMRLTAVASMTLWFAVGFAGRWIAFY